MINIIDLGFRIKQAIGLTGYNVKEFCEKTARSRVTTALWITGRGGVIRDNSLMELCADLAKCAVSCNIDWLKTGQGRPPSLIAQTEIDIPILEELKPLVPSDFKNIILGVANLSSEYYAYYADEQHIVICHKSQLKIDELEKASSDPLLVETEDDFFPCILQGVNRTKQIIHVTPFSREIISISIDKIVHMSRILFYCKKQL